MIRSLRDALRLSLHLTPPVDPLVALDESIAAGCRRQKVIREGRREAALRR